MKTRMSSVWALGLGLVVMMGGSPGVTAQEARSVSPASNSEVSPATSKSAIDMTGQFTPLSPAAPTSIDKDLKPTPTASSGHVSSWLAEIMKLARASVDDSVMLTFVDSAGTFNLSADQIIELRDAGVCTEVITAMIDHDYELLSGLRPMPAGAVAASPPALVFNGTGSIFPMPMEQRKSGTPVPSIAIELNHWRANGPLSPSEEEREPIELEQGSASTIISSASGISDDSSIVAQLPANDVEWQPVQQREAPPVRAGFSAVRAPYPVKLTDPILVFRAAERIPNIVVINMLR